MLCTAVGRKATARPAGWEPSGLTSTCTGGCEHTSAYRGSTSGSQTPRSLEDDNPLGRNGIRATPRGAVVSGLWATPRGAVVSAWRNGLRAAPRGAVVSARRNDLRVALSLHSQPPATVRGMYSASCSRPACIHAGFCIACVQPTAIVCMHSASCYRPRQRSVSSYAGK